MDTEGIVERAEKRALKVDKAIVRAYDGDLFDPTGQSCEVLDQVLAVDKRTIQFELSELKALQNIEASGETVECVARSRSVGRRAALPLLPPKGR